MTTYEILKLNQSLLEVIRSNGIDLKNLANIEIYEEYLAMHAKKHKKIYIVGYLSEKYKVSERSVYYIIDRMKKLVEIWPF